MTASPRYWVTPEGASMELMHLTHTSGNHGRRDLRDGGAFDGYCLTVRHPVSRQVLTEHYFGATVPEAELRAAFAALDAYEVTGLPAPERTAA